MDTLSKFITPGIIFLLTLASGVWLSNFGKPLNTVIFIIHKLIALGAVIVIVMQLYSVLKNTDIQTFVIMLMIVAGLCVVASFATGALMSLGKLDYDFMLIIHKIALILMSIALAMTVYILAGRKP